MASGFERGTPVLAFRGPFTHWRKHRKLLWPAFAYRVVAPRLEERKLNVLQKAVLGLCHAGERNFSRIASMLRLEPSLAAHLLKELIGNQLIDSRGEPTVLGKKLLAEERLENQELVVGFVYQDPFDGALWPRFLERQTFVDAQYGAPREEAYPRLDIGTTGRPNLVPAFRVSPGRDAVAVKPEPIDILEAVRLHLRAERLRQHEEVEDADPSEELEALFVAPPLGSPIPPRLARISFVEEEPTTVFLSCDVFLPDTQELVGWQVNDPFGLGRSLRLRRSIEQRMATDGRLRQWIHDMLDELTLQAQEVREQQLADLHALAEHRVLEVLTTGIQGSPFFEPLVVMERAHQEVLHLERCPQDKLADVLLRAQKVLERLFKEVNARHAGRHWQALTQDPHLTRRLLAEAAECMGARLPLPHRIASMPAHRIQGTARKGWGTLRPLVAISLLNARHDRHHPLRRAIQEEPGLLERLDDLAEQRDRAAHDNPDVQVTVGSVSRDLHTIYQLVRTLWLS